MDIPLLSVGLLGFGALTFFFAMRKFNRLAFYVFASVIAAFVAGVADIGQVLTRGDSSTNADSNVSSVLPLLVTREVALALSFGIRFLFFWTFVSEAPRGERPLTRASQEQPEKQSFLRMESDTHSGRWRQWGGFGVLVQYTLLLAIIAIPVLQLTWRLCAQFSKIGPLYIADGGTQISVSGLLILKLFANSRLSLLVPRWKIIRDYSPVIFALLISMGVGIGHILFFQFSETALGRLLQAMELYILVLYILISSFYHQRIRTSMIVAPQTLRNMQFMSFEGPQSRNRLPINPLKPFDNEMLSGTVMDTPIPVHRLSSWLVPQSTVLGRTRASQRVSNSEEMAFGVKNRRASGTPPLEPPRRLDEGDVETGTSTVNEEARYVASPRKSRDTKDPVYASVMRLDKVTTAPDAPPLNSRGNGMSPDSALSSVDDERYRTTQLGRTQSRGSPVYGLEGIVRYHDKKFLARESIQSARRKTLTQQQAELDRSVAELSVFSPSSYVSNATSTSNEKFSVRGREPESARSEISLSNFPEPPSRLSTDLLGSTRAAFTANGSLPSSKPSQTRTVDPSVIQPPILPKKRWSSELGVMGAAATGRAGTTYDVTSFIGDLTTPALNGMQRIPEALPVISVTDSASRLEVRMSQAPSPLVSATDANLVGPRQGPQGPRWNISVPIPRASVERSTADGRARPFPAS